MKLPVSKVAPLLFCSGLCALVYQSAWLRELRLVFGASTAASAAVLAIFMGGLGVGGVVLGKRADERKSPLMLYGNLELGVAVTAAITPPLVTLVRFLYIKLGGSVSMGLGLGTVVRLVLAAIVLLPPTLLMGGTLPAAAKAVETRDDAARRNLAVLYGVNTLGAVTGSVLATFVLLEVFGARLMLWIACALNAIVAIVARGLSRGVEDAPAAEAAAAEAPAPEPEPAAASITTRFALAASAIVGFAFFLMELVWYRMLGPVLGGSSYTFGLILALALLGVGLGGAAYATWMEKRPATLLGLAITSVLEAVAIALPFALGDRLAYVALMVRQLGALGFSGLVLGWTVVAAIVVLPAAFVSGVQFPLLIALLGRGDRGVGKQIGLAYAYNTVGAILGSLAGGFGLMPVLTAPGLWRLVVVLLGALGVGAGVLAFREDRRPRSIAWLGVTAALAAALVASRGPTEVWRHAGIGVGRALPFLSGSPNALENWARHARRAIAWEADGVESSVALNSFDGYAFVVNGKSDGHAYVDAGTQVLSGLIGAFVHDAPKNVLVIGLGTGSTAGWLGAVDAVERVDAVELEPAIVRVAAACAPVNHGVLDNPKVHVMIGDGREVLLTTKTRYDLIFSEPSNPYRAGIASLFTAEYYRAARANLAPGGIFIQWMQAYEVDGQTVRTAYATLASVFPEVETWSTTTGDLILVASVEPRVLDVPTLRKRAEIEPFRSAFEKVWRVQDLEGVLAHYLAGPGFAREIARQEAGAINTDDQNLLEFGFARSIGHQTQLSDAEIHTLARARKEDRPKHRGPIDWARVEEERVLASVIDLHPRPPAAGLPADVEKRSLAYGLYYHRDLAGALKAWREQPRPPSTSFELLVIAEALADAGNEEAIPFIEKLREQEPTEADALLAILRLKQRRPADAVNAARAALERHRADPWPRHTLMKRLIDEVVVQLAADRAAARVLFDALEAPFAVRLYDDDRKRARVKLAARADFRGLCVRAFAPLEPLVPWEQEMLALRRECYAQTGHPLAAAADADFAAFYAGESRTIGDGFREEAAPADPR